MCLGIPMKVVAISDDTAVVELTGTRRVISLSLVDEVKVGEYVLVHAGFAIQVLDEEEAAETLSMIRAILEEEG